jgi:hypothetical protein
MLKPGISGVCISTRLRCMTSWRIHCYSSLRCLWVVACRNSFAYQYRTVSATLANLLCARRTWPSTCVAYIPEPRDLALAAQKHGTGYGDLHLDSVEIQAFEGNEPERSWIRFASEVLNGIFDVGGPERFLQTMDLFFCLKQIDKNWLPMIKNKISKAIQGLGVVERQTKPHAYA